MKTVPAIDYQDAKLIVDAIVVKALQLGKSAVIAVSDAHGELIAFARMDGAPLASIRIAANKAWTAARDRKPTKDIGDKIRDPVKGSTSLSTETAVSSDGAAAFPSGRMAK